MTNQPTTETGRYVIGRDGVFATLYDRQEQRLIVENATEEHARSVQARLEGDRPRSFAEAMANPIDRAIFADSLDIALGGGCGLCDTERDHMCVGCGKCRCFDHDTCTRPAAVSGVAR